MHPEVKSVLKLLESADRKNGGVSGAFEGLVELSFCAMAKLGSMNYEQAQGYEARYMKEVARWPKENVRELFTKGFAIAATARGYDFWGNLAAETGALRGDMGQYFTPYEVCRLMASITAGDVGELVRKSKRGFFTVSEPACGSGAMLLALADEVRRQGFDPAEVMYAEATDLSNTAFRLGFLSLALAGIPALVIHGDSMTGKIFERCLTPAGAAFIRKNGNPWDIRGEGKPLVIGKPLPRVRVRPTA